MDAADTLHRFGSDEDGQCDETTNLGPVVAVTAGNGHTSVSKKDNWQGH